MKITIEPDMPEEKGMDSYTYNNIIEFGISGLMLENRLYKHSINHSHGDKFEVIGRLYGLIERLRNGDSSTK